LAEVQEGHLPQLKGATQGVKQFGATLVQDHTAANAELEQIAKQQGIGLPSKPSQNQQSEMQKLGGGEMGPVDPGLVPSSLSDWGYPGPRLPSRIFG
jgi:putative membrane protein